MNKRIKNLRKVLNLTQQEFADRLNIKRNTVATYEAGKSNPSDAAVVLICREFHVSETWLRTGEGEMFQQRTRDDELAAFMDELLAEESSDFRRRLVTALSRLSPQQWEALEAVALGLMEETTETLAVKAPQDMTLEEAQEELARQFAEQKKQVENL